MTRKSCNCGVFQNCERCCPKQRKTDHHKVKDKIQKTNIKSNLSGATTPTTKGQNHKSTGIKLPKGMIKSCKKCNKMNVNLGLRHNESPRKFQMGKATSGKCHPRGTALLCDFCDHIMSNKRPDKSDLLARALYDEEWLWLIWRTWNEHLI